MDAAVKRKWVEALRSGKYEQGKGRLRTLDNHFCCLGVLYDIVKPEAWKQGTFYYLADGFGGALTIDFEDNVNLPYKQSNILMGMNDIGKSFNEIADWIEQNIPCTTTHNGSNPSPAG